MATRNVLTSQLAPEAEPTSKPQPAPEPFVAPFTSRSNRQSHDQQHSAHSPRCKRLKKISRQAAAGAQSRYDGDLSTPLCSVTFCCNDDSCLHGFAYASNEWSFDAHFVASHCDCR